MTTNWLLKALFRMFILFLLNGKRIVLLAQDLTCCSQVSGSCKTICDKISLVEIAADPNLRNKTVREVEKFCPESLNSFWECLNATFTDVSKGEYWSGRTCCPIPQSESCRRACATATSRFELIHSCRQSDEIEFFSCLERQKLGDSCCENAATRNCQNACKQIFRSQLTPTKHQRNLVIETCEFNSPEVINCVKNYTKVTPATNLQKHTRCCDKSNEIKCRDACRQVLQTKTTLQEIVDGLQFGGCGPPLPQEPFWQCFLKPEEAVSSAEVSRIEKVGLDSAKWHCCQEASSSQCKKLCSKVFIKDWSTLWEEFQTTCLSSMSEERLRSCLDEVDEPCELGCDGLSFCTNFNGRPTELFRSCTPQADDAAKNDLLLWQKQNELVLPFLTLPLRNASSCPADVWKAVACVLQIKPCSRRSHGNQICKEDCLNLLSHCVDWNQVSEDYDPVSICSNLSPDDPEVSCVSLDDFLGPANVEYDGQVSSPCKGARCQEKEICVVDRNCAISKTCPPYSCISGCRLGEVSEYVVPEGSYVRIPIPNNPKGCLKICKCRKGKITDCQPLPCVPLTPCLISSTGQKEHGATFESDCNTCSCFAGEVICSKKQCQSTALGGTNVGYTTLPCNCSPHYVPVCGRNGNVYPSFCLAKCAGLTDADIEYEACRDPCKHNPCSMGQKCVPDPQICLSLMHRPCTQYKCINGTADCSSYPTEPVCDINNVEHPNICVLAHQNYKLAYRGPCQHDCRHLGEVCGINGRTYSSECAVVADFSTVDYEGPCVTVGLISDDKSRRCASVQCPPLVDPDCVGVTPPGACCPQCGGALRLLYSRKQIDRALYALQKGGTYPLSLRAMLKALERHVQVAQCVLRGYLSVEQDIFVMVQTTEKRPSQLQMEACVREAEKLAILVTRRSPRVVTELSLSSLTSAKVVHTRTNSGASTNPNVLLCFCVFVQMLRLLL